MLLNIHTRQSLLTSIIFHELFHFIIFKTKDGYPANNKQIKENIEMYCDCFARHVLMPTRPFFSIFTLCHSHFDETAKYFGIPQEQILRKFVESTIYNITFLLTNQKKELFEIGTNAPESIYEDFLKLGDDFFRSSNLDDIINCCTHRQSKGVQKKITLQGRDFWIYSTVIGGRFVDNVPFTDIGDSDRIAILMFLVNNKGRPIDENGKLIVRED